ASAMDLRLSVPHVKSTTEKHPRPDPPLSSRRWLPFRLQHSSHPARKRGGEPPSQRIGGAPTRRNEGAPLARKSAGPTRSSRKGAGRARVRRASARRKEREPDGMRRP